MADIVLCIVFYVTCTNVHFLKNCITRRWWIEQERPCIFTGDAIWLSDAGKSYLVKEHNEDKTIRVSTKLRTLDKLKIFFLILKFVKKYFWGVPISSHVLSEESYIKMNKKRLWILWILSSLLSGPLPLDFLMDFGRQKGEKRWDSVVAQRSHKKPYILLWLLW